MILSGERWLIAFRALKGRLSRTMMNLSMFSESIRAGVELYGLALRTNVGHCVTLGRVVIVEAVLLIVMLCDL